jgi:hypothetical protein
MQDALPVVPYKKVSRDEMNLAEFPLAMLSTRGNPKIKTLEFKDVVKGKNGELLNRHWIITGADKFGLPTASDDEVLLGLLKLTVDEGMEDRKVYFTRYELLRILRWTTEGRSYSRLQKALDRLSGVRIKASNAFYDNDNKLYNTKNFGIVDAYEINDGRDPDSKSSFFIWSEVLFKSFQAGFIKKLDLDFYLDLKSAVSKRLYRYLDKHFWYKSRVQLNLFTLSHEKVGISRNYRFASSLRQQLDPALEELIGLGFVSKAEYIGKGEGTEIAIYAGKGVTKQVETNTNDQSKFINPTVTHFPTSESSTIFAQKLQSSDAHKLRSADKNLQQADTNSVASDSQSMGEDSQAIIVEMVRRGIKQEQAVRLVNALPLVAHTKIFAIIDHYDFLLKSGSSKISRSPQGFLFHAVKNWETFMLPQSKLSSRQETLSFTNKNFTKEKINAPQASVKESLESEYLIARKQEIRHIRDAIVEKDLLQQLTSDVEKALSKIKAQISAARFTETVEHGVDEKLASLFAVPTFDEWVKGYRVKVSV